MSKPVGVVFIHGLAKKPSPEKLEEIWLDGLGRDNPRPDCFAAPNPGVNPRLMELNVTADVTFPLQPWAAFATNHFDLDNDPAFLGIPGTGPGWRHGQPLRYLVYPK